MVSDTIIRELAHDFARQQAIIIDMQRSEVKCDTIIDRQAREIGGWKEAERLCQEQRARDGRRQKAFRWLYFAGGVVAGGLLIKAQ